MNKYCFFPSDGRQPNEAFCFFPLHFALPCLGEHPSSHTGWESFPKQNQKASVKLQLIRVQSQENKEVLALRQELMWSQDGNEDSYSLPLTWSNAKLKETSKPKLDPSQNYLHELRLASRPDSPGPLLHLPDLESCRSKNSSGYFYPVLLAESAPERTFHSASPVDIWKPLWKNKQDQEMSLPLAKRDAPLPGSWEHICSGCRMSILHQKAITEDPVEGFMQPILI